MAKNVARKPATGKRKSRDGRTGKTVPSVRRALSLRTRSARDKPPRRTADEDAPEAPPPERRRKHR